MPMSTQANVPMYASTNGRAPKVDFRTAMFYPDPVDNGLYVPEFVPTLEKGLVRDFGKMSYTEVAFHVLRPWFSRDEIADVELESMIKRTYTSHVPVESMGNDYSTDLSRGSSLAFKYIGADGNAMFLGHYHNPEKNGILLDINSTSGDTGGSVGKSLHKKKGIVVFIFFPVDDITEFQRRQMSTLQDNVYAIGVNGDFDACQVLREYCLGDQASDLTGYTRTTGNSKSMGRFLPQVVYHFYGAAKVLEETGEEAVNEWIPFGNGGNFNSAQYARLMGAPLHILGAVSNENNVFPHFLETGEYNPIKAKKCPSSAMDVGNPSGIQRIAYLAGGCIDRDGVIRKVPDLELLRKGTRATSISNEKTRQGIRDAYRYGVVLDPHGAVAYMGMLSFRGDSDVDRYPNLFLRTADPSKFPDLIREELGIEPELPEHMRNIYNLEERIYKIDADKRQAADKILELV